MGVFVVMSGVFSLISRIRARVNTIYLQYMDR